MTTQSTPDAPAAPDGPDALPRWRSYVAVGDSFTEGLWDAPQGEDAPTRGWADVLAGLLSARRRAAGEAPLRYANLAVRGRLLAPVVAEQLPQALALRPDLISLVAGGNDILRPGSDPDRLGRVLDQAVARARATGADVLLATGFDSSGSPLVSATRPKVGVYNAHIWSTARRHGAYVLDLWGMRHLHDLRMWAPDRIHLTSESHARVAQGALVALGLAPDDPAWDEPLAPAPRLPRVEQARQDARWVRLYAYPWATRRLRGRSSGDTRRAKLPDLTEV
ncbi:SGNH/GDSL hydrolase family protein [Cellulomonas triticagri]|uniref:SGNH/GDSL hydrolase family protein n=1 Tax=Cellulomonas triticagri TaxID=2483352 RepID=A0A3M2JCU6_9CELL|nr:SGNH/GDSL hydrolase family protein [Cellulomonas triticagri]RMI08785.1 SGNH/GDSL hydrolase family protein [Cellulomonas triticagri]